MLIPEEDQLLPVEQGVEKELQIDLHADQVANIKLALEALKLALLQAHLPIMPTEFAHVA